MMEDYFSARNSYKIDVDDAGVATWLPELRLNHEYITKDENQTPNFNYNRQ
jgi:hypothetical protein